MDLTNTTVVITGASRGIGLGLANAFADAGIKLGLCSRTLADHQDGRRLSAPVDVTDYPSVVEFTDRVVSHLGPIDLWINNAGVLEPIAPLRDVATEDFRRHLDINIVGVFHGAKAYLRHLHATNHPGTLINISSGAARHGYAGWSAYCAGKAAVDRLSECIALEEQDTDLRVHSVAPGVIDTDMQSLIRSCPPEIFPTVERFHELKRTNGFSTTGFVAKKLLELAFDPAHKTDEVLLSFPMGQ